MFLQQKYKALSLFGHCLEIFLILLFLILYLFLRVIPHWINYADVNTAKAILSCGLIYFFYRLLGVYLPISPTLGPMLVRMTRMVRRLHDIYGIDNSSNYLTQSDSNSGCINYCLITLYILVMGHWLEIRNRSSVRIRW